MAFEVLLIPWLTLHWGGRKEGVVGYTPKNNKQVGHILFEELSLTAQHKFVIN